MGMYKYVTNRTIENSSGKITGKIRVIVKNDSADTANVDYVCPECGKSEHVDQTWQRPFSVKCSGCGFLMKVVKLKDEIKKDKKKAKAAMRGA